MKPRATVSPWKHSKHHAVHDGLELVAVCVNHKGAAAVAELVDLANGFPIREKTPPLNGYPCHCKPGVHRDNCPDCEGTGHAIDWKEFHRLKTAATTPRAVRIESWKDAPKELDPIDHGTNCAACGDPMTDPSEPYCETCARLDSADRAWIAAGNRLPDPHPVSDRRRAIENTLAENGLP